MKKVIFLLIAACVFTVAKAQEMKQFSFATTVGTGIAMSRPSSTPFSWQILGYYNITPRWAVGAGTGVSVYEKALIPLFADARFNLTKPRKFTPYLECGVGYSFAMDKNSIGGFFLNPSVGVQWAIGGTNRLQLALGYESQSLQRLKKAESQYAGVEFQESLVHSSISVKIGFMF